MTHGGTHGVFHRHLMCTLLEGGNLFIPRGSLAVNDPPIRNPSQCLRWSPATVSPPVHPEGRYRERDRTANAWPASGKLARQRARISAPGSDRYAERGQRPARQENRPTYSRSGPDCSYFWMSQVVGKRHPC